MQYTVVSLSLSAPGNTSLSSGSSQLISISGTIWASEEGIIGIDEPIRRAQINRI
jgi:hypothetical protein